ncbi:MAG: class A beta-lactamase-related serine hydrolase, partial [Bacteroidetes bacterium]
MKIRFFYALLWSFCFTVSFAQPPGLALTTGSPESVGFDGEKLKNLDRHIEKFIANKSMPGGVFLVARKGKIVYFKNFGHHTTAGKTPYQKGDIFRLASMTKAITTVAVLQLYEQGRLGLDDPLYYYIPAFKEAQILKDFNPADSSFTTTPAQNPITIRHLLTHTSGITYGVFNPGKIGAIYEKIGANQFGLSHPTLTTEEMVEVIARVPLLFEPGTEFKYGLNMEVLGRVVEVVSGMPLDQYFKENIFDPLGMEDTWFYLPKDKQDRLVPVYTYDENRQLITAPGDGPTGADYPKAPRRNHFAGGGGLSGTAHDYAIFAQALLNGGAYNGKRILSRKTIDVMTADQLISLNEKGTGYSNIPGLSFGLGFAIRTEEAQAVSPKSPGTFEWSGYFNTKF